MTQTVTLAAGVFAATTTAVLIRDVAFHQVSYAVGVVQQLPQVFVLTAIVTAGYVAAKLRHH